MKIVQVSAGNRSCRKRNACCCLVLFDVSVDDDGGGGVCGSDMQIDRMGTMGCGVWEICGGIWTYNQIQMRMSSQSEQSHSRRDEIELEANDRYFFLVKCHCFLLSDHP